MRPPQFLDKVARDHWKLVVELLVESGNWNRVDQDCIALYCALYSRWREADSKVKEHGLCVPDDKGNPRKNPYLQIANETARDMKAYQDRLGLSPQARAKLKPLDPITSDPLQDFLAGGP